VGSQSGKIGDRDYLFAVIEPEELNLFPEYPDAPPIITIRFILIISMVSVMGIIITGILIGNRRCKG